MYKVVVSDNRGEDETVLEMIDDGENMNDIPNKISVVRSLPTIIAVVKSLQ